MKLMTFVFLALLVVSVKANPISNKTLLFPLQLICSPLANKELSVNTQFISTIQNNKNAISPSLQQLADQLYNSVITGDYEDAVTKSLQLEQDDKSQVIIDTVKKLLSDRKRNVVDFAYKLWNMFGKGIVKDYFPVEFKMVFKEDSVVFIDKKYGLQVDISSFLGNVGRIGYGRNLNERAKLVLKPIWEDHRVYFKVVYPLHYQYLKMTNNTFIENNLVYTGDHHNTYAQQWYLHPSMYKGDLLFYIINREYNLAMKFTDTLDQNQSRLLSGYKGVFVDNPERFGWYIKPF